MTVSPEIILMFFAFPLFAECFFAYHFQEVMGWEQACKGERALLTGIFLCITFPALILPAMGFTALAGNFFNSIYY
jgi:hypothetical protein